MIRRVLALLGAALLIACPTFPTGTAESGVRSVVTTGHTGAVLGLRYDSGRHMLFSSGDDGTVRVWDMDSGALAHCLQVTRSNTRAMAIDPSSARLAVVVTDGIRSFALSVWDWNEERQLYRVALTEEPQFLRFSPKGTYLLYGTSSWQGLHLLNASDGTQRAFHPEGFGIVAFANVSDAEDALLSYQVSGKLSSWDLATGDLTREIRTVPYLSMARISASGQVLAGYTGQSLVAIDTQTGSSLGQVAVPSVSSLDISAAGDELATVAAGKLTRWAIASGAIRPAARQPQLTASAPAPTQVCYGGDGLFVGDGSGEVRGVPTSGAERLIGKNELSSVSGFDARGGMLAVASSDWIRVFCGDTAPAGGSDQAPGFVYSMECPNPFRGPVGLTFVSPTRLLAWRRDGAPPILAFVDIPQSGASLPEKGAFRTLTSAFRAPLTSFHLLGSLAVGVESTGTVRCVDLSTGSSIFDMRVPGVSSAVPVSPTAVLAGRSAVLATDSSLLRIDITTGETVGVKDPNVFTYGLEDDLGTAAGSGAAAGSGSTPAS
ncbi:MAG TPA: hypothetical protein VFH83_05145, partial [Spirochaetia bacterium]|nr:hypothetical protein [Spirochaetia bacterium]